LMEIAPVMESIRLSSGRRSYSFMRSLFISLF